ncbi:MAG: NADH-quinone oxidoreductase subunit J [Anaerolineae bacterium]|nr:NADH-quinone oxidoreductase subunit J [Anaerolineae bacterium]
MFSSQQITFILFSALILGAAIRVVTCRRIFHASMWLIVAFFGIAAVYLLLDSPFLAGIQLFLYIGGVAVLTVIAIMVTKGIMLQTAHTTHDPWAAAIMALAVFITMTWSIVQIPWPDEPLYAVAPGQLALLGGNLVDPQGFLLPFEVVSLVMVVVLISSLYLGKEK